MLDNIQILITQLRVLRKCGISTIFAPWQQTDQSKRKEFSIKSVALLNGYEVDDFDSETWTRVLDVVDTGVFSLNQAAGFTDVERAQFEPLLESAKILLEAISGFTAELAGNTITIGEEQ